MPALGVACLGIDWFINPSFARQMAGKDITLQGNFDPAKLLAPIPVIMKAVTEMLQAFGEGRYVANLGHGILPYFPVDCAMAFVDTANSFEL